KGKYYAGIGEQTHLLIGLAGMKTREFWNEKPEVYSIFDLKAAVESLFRTLNILSTIETKVEDKNTLQYFIDEEPIGTVFRPQEAMLDYFDIDKPVYIAEFSLTVLYNYVTKLEERRYQPVPKFPSFEFDFAVVVDAGVRAKKLLNTITENAEKLDNIQVFDLFENEAIGKGNKSIGFRLSFLDKNKTLTINDIEPIIEKILKVLKKKYSATLRDY